MQRCECAAKGLPGVSEEAGGTKVAVRTGTLSPLFSILGCRYVL